MRAKDHEWEHEIRVALPPSYAHTERLYPVLWVLDNGLETALGVLESLVVAGQAPESILVSVGSGRVPVAESGRRRTYDLVPTGNYYFAGPQSDYLRTLQASQGFTHPGGGASKFLDFLVDDVRPALTSEYRVDPDDHVLAGFSAAGLFVGYALFARPGAFARYISGSPVLYSGNCKVFDLEERYAADHDDLPAHVFFGAGGGEIAESGMAAFGGVSSMMKMAEILYLRAYPSLGLTVKLLPGETHASAWPPLLSWGVRSVWADKIAAEQEAELAQTRS